MRAEDWMDMESAPRDGSVVILFTDKGVTSARYLTFGELPPGMEAMDGWYGISAGRIEGQPKRWTPFEVPYWTEAETEELKVQMAANMAAIEAQIEANKYAMRRMKA